MIGQHLIQAIGSFLLIFQHSLIYVIWDLCALNNARMPLFESESDDSPL